MKKFSHEKLNLLYVAMTRAKQMLIISGIQSKKSSQHNWHSHICKGLNIEVENIWTQEHGCMPTLTAVTEGLPQQPSYQTPTQLFEKLSYKTAHKNTETPSSNSAANEGTIIHKILEIISVSSTISLQALANRVQLETSATVSSH